MLLFGISTATTAFSIRLSARRKDDLAHWVNLVTPHQFEPNPTKFHVVDLFNEPGCRSITALQGQELAIRLHHVAHAFGSGGAKDEDM
ncbi:hypothetical protein [Sinorhizobium meliloti]|uniref:hypothetical protein n=1 Tax=Rhizobium meliloti TaxID=382 RepID=UPI0012FD6087|nr:hypothetical protein [Sinorhizobium meliloti]